MGTAGPHVRAPDPSGQRRTSTASSRSQWATPDLNSELPIPVGNAGPQRRAPDPSGQRRTSTARSTSQWATPEDMSDRMPEDMSDRIPEDMPDRMPEDMPDRMPEDMTEDMPDRMPNRLSEDMSDRMPEDLPVRKCINVMVGITRSKVIFMGETGDFTKEQKTLDGYGPLREYRMLHVPDGSVSQISGCRYNEVIGWNLQFLAF